MQNTHSHTLDEGIESTCNQKRSQPCPCTWSELRGDLLRVFTQVISADEDVHCYEEGSTGKRRTAYPSELLDSTKYPHHSINLLLQPSGPVLHTARDRENERRKGRERKRESQSPDTQ